MQEIIIPIGEAAKKLENFLKKEFPIGYIRKLFRKNGIRLNGRRARPDDPVHANDRVQIYFPFESDVTKTNPTNSQSQLEIIYEDEALLVINKQAGIAVHEGKTVSKRHTVVAEIEKKFRDSATRPQLVHRLDRETSGLLLLAKSAAVLADLENQFETGQVDKQYICLVAGRLAEDSATIVSPLPGRDGKPARAVTRYRVAKRYGETTLVRVNLETGRHHQIRLHFAELGHPVALDDQHGDFIFNKRFRKTWGLKRQFLHAAELSLTYGGKRRHWSAKIPEDLEQTLRQLEKNF